MRKTVFLGVLGFVFGGCALVPVQDQTLTNANGGSITCKQVGAGIFSSGIGKARFDDCVASAHANGYQ